MKILIKEYREADINTIIPYPGNWREHPLKQKRILLASLEENGWVTPIIVNKRTMHVMDGHLRLEQAKMENMEKIPTCFINVPESEEKKVILYLDSVTREAKTDDEKWRAIAENCELQSAEMLEMLKKMQKQAALEKGQFEDDIPKIQKRYKYILLVYKDEINYINHIERFGSKSKFFNIVDGDKLVL